MHKYLINRITTPSDEPIDKVEATLNIMEFFYDTIQGEGASIGSPAAFLRLQGCTLDCIWCDTEWRLGSTFTLTEIFQRMNAAGLPEKLGNGQRLILTGGSPLKQEKMLSLFIYSFVKRYKFKPIIEIENECTLLPNELMISLINQWNNSPKLSSSGMKRKARYKPDIIRTLSLLKNSWFKFVIECDEDWVEIQMDFLDPELIRKDQIILMPLGATYKELQKTNRLAMRMAVRHGVRFTTREQLVLQVP